MRMLERTSHVTKVSLAASGGEFKTPVSISDVRAFNLTAKPGDLITGAMAWRNNTLPSGISVIAGYALAERVGDDDLWFIRFYHDGYWYVDGCRVITTTPSQGGSRNNSLPSEVLNFEEEVTLSAFTFVAQGTLATLSMDGRVVALDWDHFVNLTWHGRQIFHNVLTVKP